MFILMLIMKMQFTIEDLRETVATSPILAKSNKTFVVQKNMPSERISSHAVIVRNERKRSGTSRTVLNIRRPHAFASPSPQAQTMNQITCEVTQGKHKRWQRTQRDTTKCAYKWQAFLLTITSIQSWNTPTLGWQGYTSPDELPEALVIHKFQYF